MPTSGEGGMSIDPPSRNTAATAEVQRSKMQSDCQRIRDEDANQQISGKINQKHVCTAVQCGGSHKFW